MPWALRGLRNGVVTSGYPARPDGYFDSWHGVAQVLPEAPPVEVGEAEAVAACCPTAAIAVHARKVVLEAGRCIGCGRCVTDQPGRFGWRWGSDLARFGPGPTGGTAQPNWEQLAALRLDLALRVRAFGRSVHLRHVDAGSDGSEEWEIAALLNPVYDIHRLGLFFTASPRHADILLVTGAGVAGMREPLQRTLAAMPNPIVVVAVGTDACTGGLHHGSYAGADGAGPHLPVDVQVPGSPPSPFAILHGLLLALGRIAPAPDSGSGQRTEVTG